MLIGIIVEMIPDVLNKPKEFREVILNGFKVVSAVIMHGEGSGRINLEAIGRTALRTRNSSQHINVHSFLTAI